LKLTINDGYNYQFKSYLNNIERTVDENIHKFTSIHIQIIILGIYDRINNNEASRITNIGIEIERSVFSKLKMIEKR
jgi:hypothetical protein